MPANELLILGVNERLMAVRVTDGSVAWSHDFHGRSLFGEGDRPTVPLSIAFVGRRLFAASFTKLVCFDYDTGSVIGAVDLGSQRVPPTLYSEGERLFAYTSDTLFCLNVGGQVLWRTPHALSKVSAARPTIAMPGHVQPGDR